MLKARISELRNGLSRYLDHVRSGGRVLILDRSRPVAEIVPIESAKDTTSEGLLEALEREGIVRKGTGKIPQEIWTRPPGRGAGVLAALLEERRSGR
jgi:prevent-host-death family protein